MGKLNKTTLDRLVGKEQKAQLELSDGNNLYVVVTKVGSCKFKYRIRTNKTASWIALGDYPAMTLDDARRESLYLKSMVKNGIDPIAKRKHEKSKQITFKQLADMYCNERLPIVRTKERSRNVFIKTVDSQITSVIGDLFITNIDDNLIRTKLINPKLDQQKHAKALQIKNMIKVILDYACEKNILSTNPVTTPRSYNIITGKSRSRYLSYEEISIILQTLYKSDTIKTVQKMAIHLLLMLLTRKTELTEGRWKQVDLDQAKYVIEVSKMDSQLSIPLPRQAIELFNIIKEISQRETGRDVTASDYIFMGVRPNTTICKQSLNRISGVLNCIIFGNDSSKYFTIHDLRRTGATHLGEMGYPSDYIEVALNHTKGGIKKVYQRSQYIDQRREMLQKWADKLDELIGADLLPYGKKFVI